MTISMSKAAVPVFTTYLTNLAAFLAKAAANAESRKIDQTVFITARLAPDMFALARQVQIATDHAKGAVARLAGIAVPSFADTETSFDELQARIQKTLDFIATVPAESIDGSEDRDIALKAGPNELHFKGEAYLTTFALPNFFFHLTTAYAILRHNGVDVGKRDFLGMK